MATKKKQTFEEKLAAVETLVSGLEEGNTSLKDTVEQYETGMALLRELEKELGEVEQRLTVIRKGADGEMTEEPLEVTE